MSSEAPVHPVRTGQARQGFPVRQSYFILRPFTPPIPLGRGACRSRLWTDDFSNIVSVFKWSLTGVKKYEGEVQ
jgi:hypothetical protein